MFVDALKSVEFLLKIYSSQDILFVFGMTAPQWAWASSFMRFLITHDNASQSVGPLWRSDQLIAETST
jgi:hypothetical protein